MALLALFCCATADRATAQASLYGECRIGTWSSNRNLDDTGGLVNSTCLVNAKHAFTEQSGAAFNLRVQDGRGAEASDFSGRVREAYVHADFGPVTVRAGRQIIVWGRSDRISPTDVVGARDYTFRSGDDDEQREGTDSLLLRWHLNEAVSVTGLTSRFEPHRLPTGQLPAGRLDPVIPTRPEYGLRIDRNGAGFDASLSYFDGFDKGRRYWFGPNVAIPSAGIFQHTYEPIRMVGLDAATSSGRWTFRGELARIRTTPDCGGCPLAGRTVSRAVIGVDRDVLESGNVSLQLFGVRRSGYIGPDSQPGAMQTIGLGLDRLNAEFGAIERGATFRIADRFLNDRLRAEFSGILDLTQSSELLRGRLSYALSDRGRLDLGIDRFRGPPQSYFGSRRRNDAAWVELAWLF